MLRAIDAAKYLVSLNNYFNSTVPDENKEILSNLKIQKLLYYAQGAYLAMYDKPLFCENLHAWTYGPVVTDVYHAFKVFGANNVEIDPDFDTNILSVEEKNVLDEVYEALGKYTASQLVEMTHNEAPWKLAFGKPNDTISNDEIKIYFLENYISD